jgi:hypothetical protein
MIYGAVYNGVSKLRAVDRENERMATEKCTSRGMERMTINGFYVCRDRSGRIWFFDALEKQP